MEKSLIVIDCQYDFIYGSLACLNAEKAVRNIIRFINDNPNVNVYYSSDWHTKQNKSFKENGGIWPAHCVQNERGSELHSAFTKKIVSEKNRPNIGNVYYKGIDDDVEEYSAFNARNKAGESLKDTADKHVMIAGIASEFCCRETAIDFQLNEHKVEFMKDMLGYVNYEEHLRNLTELEKSEILIKD